MSLLDALAERRIAEAIAAGELDALPGAGQPLKLDDDSLVPEDQRMAWRILKNAGLAPPEVQHRRELADELDAAGATGDDASRRRAIARLDFLLVKAEACQGRRSAALDDYYERMLERIERN